MSAFKGTPGPWQNVAGAVFKADDRNVCVADLVGCYGMSDEEAARNAAAIAQVPRMVEAIATFSAWLEREEKGGEGQPWREKRGTPEGEAAWRVWYSENLRLCDLAQAQAKAVLAALRESGAIS